MGSSIQIIKNHLVPGGHLDFLEMLKGKKSTLTWKHLPRPYMLIIRREKKLYPGLWT